MQKPDPLERFRSKKFFACERMLTSRVNVCVVRRVRVAVCNVCKMYVCVGVYVRVDVRDCCVPCICVCVHACTSA